MFHFVLVIGASVWILGYIRFGLLFRAIKKIVKLILGVINIEMSVKMVKTVGYMLHKAAQTTK